MLGFQPRLAPTMWSVARIGVMTAKPETKRRKRMRWVEFLDMEEIDMLSFSGWFQPFFVSGLVGGSK